MTPSQSSAYISDATRYQRGGVRGQAVYDRALEVLRSQALTELSQSDEERILEGE
jgi:hypothetical protein